jgi:ribosomal protein L29
MNTRPAIAAVTALAASVCLMSAGCMTAERAEPQPTVVRDTATEERLAREIEELKGELQRTREELATERSRNDDLEETIAGLESQLEQLQGALEEKEVALASLEEQYAALEIELTSAVEEVLRSMARVRTVQSRAQAVSRIAEVRVQLESVPRAQDQEVAARLRRAREFLGRADAVLSEGNFGGASFLAERANDLVRQARMVSEIRSSAALPSGDVIAIVPPRSLEVLENSNLREGPGIDTRRIGSVRKGEHVIAVARTEDWFQVENPSGGKAWISGDLVR